MRRLWIVVFFLLPLTLRAATPSESAKLRKLFRDEWEWQLQDDPERATRIGDKRYDDRLTDRSPAAYENRRVHYRESLAKIKAIDRSKLSADDQLNYDFFRVSVQDQVDAEKFPREYIQATQMEGVYSALSELAQAIPKDNGDDYLKFITRIRLYPEALRQAQALMTRGMDAGVTPPRVILQEVPELIRNQIDVDPTKTPIYQLAFNDMPESIPAETRATLRHLGANAIRTEVMPAMRQFLDFFEKVYLPKSRETIGWTDVPDGKAWYAWAVRSNTTTDLTPDQIHEMGLAEVKRIRGEMEKIKDSTGFKGSLAEFFNFLRTDPRFFYTEREALLEGYRDVAKRIDPNLMKLFGTLPRTPYGVIPVPSYSEKVQTTAYYNIGSPEGHRPGYMFANLYNLPARPKWEMEALTLHEAVPGHHLQLTLAQELQNVPKLRQHGEFTAFVEGWGLYAESLGPELGMYTDPYSKFGQLTYEMWRAVRLVVDTGMHTKGWTREQAIQYFSENASKTQHDIEVEVDRYLAWPGQALAYKIGDLKFKELRAYAERQLGAKFDVRAFHDELLGAGALPLSLVEKRVRGWVQSSQSSPAPRERTAPKGGR